MRANAVLSVCSVLASAAGAQQIVFPSQAAATEGAIAAEHFGKGAPWTDPSTTSATTEFKMQLISDLPASFNGTISDLWFRRDGNLLPGFDLLQFTVEMEVTMSTGLNSAATASATFASNAGANAVVVLPRRFVIFGGNTFDGALPEDFKYRLRLLTPFNYNAAQGSLCIEFKHFQNGLGVLGVPLAIDAVDGSSVGGSLSLGGRCFWSNTYLPPVELHAEQSVANGMLQFHAWRQHGQHHSRGYLLGSLGHVGFGLGVPTSLLQAGSCGTIDVNLAQQFFFAFGVSNDYGQVRWPTTPGTYLWNLPYNPTWVGFKFWVQELSFSQHGNGYWASNAVLTQIPSYFNGGPPGLRVVHASGAGSHSAATGTVEPLGVGPVVRYN